MARKRTGTASVLLETLRGHLANGVTGCISAAGLGAGTYRVYVMEGEILAAHGPHDEQAIIHRLVNWGALTAEQGREHLRRFWEGERLEELLLGEVPDEVFFEVLAGRFRQNLYDFIGLPGPAEFSKMDVIFVDNIQVGHDSCALLDELWAVRQATAELSERRDELVLRPGAARPRQTEHFRLLESCKSGLTLAELLDKSPFEEVTTLEAVSVMREEGVLVAAERAADQPYVPEVSVDEAAEHEPVPQREAGGEPDAAVAQQFSAPLSEGGEALKAIGEIDEIDRDRASDAALEAALRHAGETSGFHETARDRARQTEEEIVRRPPDFDLATEVEVDEAELAMFEDHDTVRGGSAGLFSLSNQQLEYVDLRPEGGPVGDPGLPADEDQLLEMDDASDLAPGEHAGAVALNFSGPRLPVDEAKHKLGVARDVLMRIAAAIDAHQGPGSGRTCIQLLLDGTPGAYAVLFRRLEATAEGGFDVDAALKNLARRPATEHRRLLNGGLSDLIERALSVAVEELPDGAVDELLEEIAGYQQRLGL